MVSGFEKRMLSGMFGLLSVDCARAGEVASATASVTAPGATRLRETWVENCCKSSEESVSAIVSIAVLAPEGRFALVHSGQFIQKRLSIELYVGSTDYLGPLRYFLAHIVGHFLGRTLQQLGTSVDHLLAHDRVRDSRNVSVV